MRPMRYSTFTEWFEKSGAEKTAVDIKERLQCTQAAALQILLLMDMNGLFSDGICGECERPLDDADPPAWGV